MLLFFFNKVYKLTFLMSVYIKHQNFVHSFIHFIYPIYFIFKRNLFKKNFRIYFISKVNSRPQQDIGIPIYLYRLMAHVVRSN